MSLAIPKRLQGMSPSHNRAKVQEKETAKRIGGVQTKGSGSGHVKGDVRLKGMIRVENKTTKNKSFSVTCEHIDKLKDAVFGSGEIPMMQVEINSGSHKFVVIPDTFLDFLLDAAGMRGGEG